MMKLTLALGLSLFAAACTAPSVVSTPPASFEGMASFQDEGDMGAMGDPEVMKRMMTYMTPTKEHREMAERVGTWNIHSKMWMAPGAPEMTMDSVAETEMILGGRYLVERSKGSFMGQPFEGQLTMGYNTLTEEWWSMWIDSMGTGYALATGKKNEAGGLEMSGTMQDAVNPDGRPYRMTSHPMNDKGEVVMEMYDTLPDGTEWKVMEMTYTKKAE